MSTQTKIKIEIFLPADRVAELEALGTSIGEKRSGAARKLIIEGLDALKAGGEKK